MRRCVLLLAMVGALSGCAAMGAPSCGPGGQPELVAEMVFGRNIGNSLGVSEADWNRFVDDEVTRAIDALPDRFDRTRNIEFG